MQCISFFQQADENKRKKNCQSTHFYFNNRNVNMNINQSTWHDRLFRPLTDTRKYCFMARTVMVTHSLALSLNKHKREIP